MLSWGKSKWCCVNLYICLFVLKLVENPAPKWILQTKCLWAVLIWMWTIIILKLLPSDKRWWFSCSESYGKHCIKYLSFPPTLLSPPQDLMTSSRIQKNPMLQQVACLGYSSVVNRYCSQTSACPKEALQVGSFFSGFNTPVMFITLS